MHLDVGSAETSNTGVNAPAPVPEQATVAKVLPALMLPLSALNFTQCYTWYMSTLGRISYWRYMFDFPAITKAKARRDWEAFRGNRYKFDVCDSNLIYFMYCRHCFFAGQSF